MPSTRSRSEAESPLICAVVVLNAVEPACSVCEAFYGSHSLDLDGMWDPSTRLAYFTILQLSYDILVYCIMSLLALASNSRGSPEIIPCTRPTKHQWSLWEWPAIVLQQPCSYLTCWNWNDVESFRSLFYDEDILFELDHDSCKVLTTMIRDALTIDTEILPTKTILRTWSR